MTLESNNARVSRTTASPHRCSKADHGCGGQYDVVASTTRNCASPVALM